MAAMRRLILLVVVLCFLPAKAQAAPATATSGTRAVEWSSAATGTTLHAEILLPADAPGAMPTVVYLKNLALPRLGQEPDDPILADLAAQKCVVLVLDYAHHPKSISPDLNADILKIRQDITGKTRTLLADQKVDANRLYILLEGFGLKRDVEFARDGKRVLAMDIFYPAKPAKKVAVLMEITCDNANRMGSGSLLFCRDTLIEGAQA